MILNISFDELFYYGYIIPIFIMLLWLMWKRSRLKDKYATYLDKDALALLIPGTALFGVILLALYLFLYYGEKLTRKLDRMIDK